LSRAPAKEIAVSTPQQQDAGGDKPPASKLSEGGVGPQDADAAIETNEDHRGTLIGSPLNSCPADEAVSMKTARTE
jgi:hypothetical protein